MSKLKMNCAYCGRKCSLEKDFCIPQDSVYVCKTCYEWQSKVSNLEAKLAESEKELEIVCIDGKDTIREFAHITTCQENEIKQLKQKLNIALEDFNDIQKEHDKLCDMVVEKDKKIEYFKKELRKECDEHARFVVEADNMVKDFRKAFRLAIFELDFARHHTQSTTDETVERIEKLTDEIWNKAIRIKGEL